MAHKVTLIPGDGIGPEVTAAAVRILEATGVKFEWESYAAGADAYEKYHEYIPKELTESVERTRVALKGPVTTPIGGGFSSINVQLRRQFELFCNFRPIRNLPGVATRYPGVDLIIIRENTEGLYSGIEHEVVPGVVESIKVITEKASTRISRWAFEYARKFGRKKVHAIHKANIMKLSDGLFIRCSRNMSKEYPEISYGEHIVDNTCMQLVTNPYQYDMLLLENLYGDIVSDLCAAFVGGLGLVPGANFGHECAIFEAVHGSAPDIAGRGIANPTAVTRSGILMLRHLGEQDAANRVKYAVHSVYREGKHITRDMGGEASTSEFADAVIEALQGEVWREQAERETNPV
ncbi:MAG: isocitrate/isopropylmalate family dehydrogenase [Acidobacteriota bacterium]|nr:isocitrate/isopropylmalate family dehydrogenase [Acidobacteriota bacterium]